MHRAIICLDDMEDDGAIGGILVMAVAIPLS